MSRRVAPPDRVAGRVMVDLTDATRRAAVADEEFAVEWQIREPARPVAPAGADAGESVHSTTAE